MQFKYKMGRFNMEKFLTNTFYIGYMQLIVIKYH